MKLIKNINSNNILSSIIIQYDDNYILTSQEEDITTDQNIKLLYMFGILDYKGMRRCYKYLANNFNSLESFIKDKICELCATNPNTIIGYFMSKGMSLEQASYQYLSNRADDIVLAAKCCESYIKSSKFIKTILTYLPLDQAEMFLDDIKELQYKYSSVGHFGIGWGDLTVGILNYIMCNDVYEFTGLSKYKLNNQKTLVSFQTDLMNILYDGNIN